MKNFLKSTAIFACVALMFCACSDDDATNAQIEANASSVRSVVPGNGKIKVTWSVPSSGSEEVDGEIVALDGVTMCVISWTDGADVNESYCMEVNAGSTTSYTIEGLVAGTYTVTIENYGDVEIISPVVTRTVEVYDASTYTEEPTVNQVLVQPTVDDPSTATAIFDWNELPEDCIGVVITYTDAAGDTKSTPMAAIDPDSPTIVVGVKDGTTVTYSSFFQPEDGLDEVVLTYGTKASIPTLASIEAAADVAVRPGDYKLQVEWGIANDSSVKQTLVIYEDSVTTCYYFIDAITINADNVFQITDVPVGTYTVSVQNVDANGALSAAVFVEDVEVYDLIDYENSVSTPDYYAAFYDEETYALTIKWMDDPSYKSIFMEYTVDFAGNTSSVEVDMETLRTEIATVVPGSEYKTTTVFVPSGNGLDTLTRTVVTRLPDAPVTKYLTIDGVRDYQITQYPMKGDVTMAEGDYAFYKMFDKDMAYTNPFQYLTVGTVDYQTLTIDLGQTFRVSKFVYTPCRSYGFEDYRYAMKTFSLYGTATLNPADDVTLNAVTEATASLGTAYQVPDLTNWEPLLVESVVYSAYRNTDYTYDYNGDGRIDSQDDTDLITDGISFEISETAPPVRYLRLQFIDSYNAADNTAYMINELAVYHRGIEE